MTPEERIRILAEYPGILLDESNVLDSIKSWYKTKELTNHRVSKYNEPNNLDELVLPLFQETSRTLNQSLSEIDIQQEDLVANHNDLKSKIDNLTSLVKKITNEISHYSIIKEDETLSYLWVSDNLNTSNFTDESTTAFLNTNKGEVTLNFDNYQKVTKFYLRLDDENLIKQQALPGSTLLLSNTKPAIQTTTTVSSVLFDNTPSKNVYQLIDEDPSSYFEVEKNYIFKNQKLAKVGKAFVSDDVGSILNVEQITSDIDGNPLDWQSQVIWPSTNKANPTPIASFVDISDDAISSKKTLDSGIFPPLKLTIILDLIEPTQLSIVSLSPIIKAGYPNLVIESITCEADGFQEPFYIAKNRIISGKSFLEDDNYVLGIDFSIPTSRKIKKITINLSTGISKKVYFGHPFAWVNIQRRSERSYIFFSSVDYEDTPQRIKIFNEPPVLSTLDQGPNGAEFLNIEVDAPKEGTVTSSESKGGLLSGLKDIVKAGISTYLNGTSSITQILPGNTKKVSVPNSSTDVGKVLSNIPSTIIDKVLDVGSFDRTFTVTDQEVGFDVFAGVRSSIALSNISLAQIKYQKKNVFLSKELKFSQKVSTLGLVVEESIPDTWGENDWIKYYYSTDGLDFKPIIPLKGQSFAESIQLNNPTSSVWLKAELYGNSEDSTSTPKILNYSFAGKPI